MASSRSGTAIPTWSIAVKRWVGRDMRPCSSDTRPEATACEDFLTRQRALGLARRTRPWVSSWARHRHCSGRHRMSGSVIVAGARTPIGRLLGGLKDQSAAQLGGVAIAGALEKAGVSGDQVDYVIMGQVIQAGAGQNAARTAARNGGIPMNVPSITINKVCLSGVNAIALADQLIRSGEVDVVVAGGMESMTNAPHLLPKSREGFKYGEVTLVDYMAHDALWDQATQQALGAPTEDYNKAHTSLTREEQDAFAAASH